ATHLATASPDPRARGDDVGAVRVLRPRILHVLRRAGVPGRPLHGRGVSRAIGFDPRWGGGSHRGRPGVPDAEGARRAGRDLGGVPVRRSGLVPGRWSPDPARTGLDVG